MFFSHGCPQANAQSEEGVVRGTVLLNCAGGMNTKVCQLLLHWSMLPDEQCSRCYDYGVQGLVDDWRVRLAFPFFMLIDFLLSRQRIARYLFDNFRTKDNLKNVLRVRAMLNLITFWPSTPELAELWRAARGCLCHLQRVYMNEDAVDDALVDLIHLPSGVSPSHASDSSRCIHAPGMA